MFKTTVELEERPKELRIAVCRKSVTIDFKDGEPCVTLPEVHDPHIRVEPDTRNETLAVTIHGFTATINLLTAAATIEGECSFILTTDLDDATPVIRLMPISAMHEVLEIALAEGQNDDELAAIEDEDLVLTP